LVSLAFLIPAQGILAAEEGDEPVPDPITHLRGYVYNIPAQEERAPIEGVSVTTWLSADKEYQTVTTDSNGEFLVDYNSDIRFISFSIAEYTVKGWCSELHKYGDTGIYEIVLKNDSQNLGVHDLFDDSGYTAIVSLTNAMVYGTVYTTIESSAVTVANASVSLISSKTALTAKTDSSGNFSFNCSSGVEYKLIVSSGGFEVWSSDITPSDEPVQIELVQKSHAILFGLDIAHTTALFGLLLTLLVALIAIYVMKRPEKEGGVRIINDIMPVDTEDRDEREE